MHYALDYCHTRGNITLAVPFSSHLLLLQSMYFAYAHLVLVLPDRVTADALIAYG